MRVKDEGWQGGGDIWLPSRGQLLIWADNASRARGGEVEEEKERGEKEKEKEKKRKWIRRKVTKWAGDRMCGSVRLARMSVLTSLLSCNTLPCTCVSCQKNRGGGHWYYQLLQLTKPKLLAVLTWLLSQQLEPPLHQYFQWFPSSLVRLNFLVSYRNAVVWHEGYRMFFLHMFAFAQKRILVCYPSNLSVTKDSLFANTKAFLYTV